MSVVNYDVLYDELLQEYLGLEYYPAVNNPTTYISTAIEATTIDEYLTLLIKGFINVRIRPELDKHIMELLADDWFHQWPLVRWTYATRLLDEEKLEEKFVWAITTLDALAKEGWPNAMCNIGDLYFIGKYREENQKIAVGLWLVASKKGYRDAFYKLLAVFRSHGHEKLGEELQLLFLEELQKRYLEFNDTTLETYKDRLDKHDTNEVSKIISQKNKIEKSVSARMLMRSSAAGLIWDKDENPYKIDF